MSRVVWTLTPLRRVAPGEGCWCQICRRSVPPGQWAFWSYDGTQAHESCVDATQWKGKRALARQKESSG